MNLENIFKTVLDAAFTVHTNPGPGLLESAYENCLYYELKQNGIKVDRQVALPLVYKEIKLEAGYRIDLPVERAVIVEIKSIDSLADIHMAQILTYLRLSGCKLVLLANFNVNHFKDGFRRVIN